MSDNAAQESVTYGVDGAVATITLNRPAAMNALNTQTKEALLASLRRAGSDSAIRGVVLTGAGRGFCGGQDLREHALLLETGQGAGTVRQHYNPIVTAIVSMPKPVIAAVNGVAAGAGASLALACDLRIAAEGARMVMAFAQVGLGPDSGASWTLQHLAGRGRAAEMLMLAEPVDAARMLELGLVNAVVPADELHETAARLAARLAEGPTAAYAAIKEALDFAACHGLPEALVKEAELQEALAETEDHLNATEAFSRKERPQFKGR